MGLLVSACWPSSDPLERMQQNLYIHHGVGGKDKGRVMNTEEGVITVCAGNGLGFWRLAMRELGKRGGDVGGHQSGVRV